MIADMLDSIVNAAANWILAGLPLVCLKIVAYTDEKIEKAVKNPQMKILIDLFNKEKQKWENRKIQWKEPNILYDIFVSYSEKDEHYVRQIKEQLVKDNEGIRIYSEKHKLDLNEVWQKEIYDTMTTCLRVMPVLTPNYLSSAECVEEYNIAMCCSRAMHRDLLAPLYVQQIDHIPVYMQQIQYLDCTKLADVTEGCEVFTKSVLNRRFSQMVGRKKRAEYDVFVSYCHANTKEAEIFVDKLKTLKPDLKIFFDRHELQIGVSWQQILYHAIDSCNVVLALLSPSYIESAVCTEEYNLALASHLSWESELELVPIAIEEIPNIKEGFRYVPAVDATDSNSFSDAANAICRGVINFLDVGAINFEMFHETRVKHNIAMALCNSRKAFFNRTFQFDEDNQLKPKKPTNTVPNKNEDKRHADNFSCDIFISVSRIDRHYGYGLKHILSNMSDDKLVVHVDCDAETSQLSKLSNSRLVVAILSPGYLASTRENQELHSALCRHRASVGKPVLYVIQASKLNANPIYAHLIPCNIACHDNFWADHLGIFGCRNRKAHLPSKATIAMTVAAEDIISILSEKRTDVGNDILINIVSKVSGKQANKTIDIPKNFLKGVTLVKNAKKS
ncbi:uncharacterized protein LOC141907613 isoform X2 [Tubulanus polymorphus]